MDTKSLLYGLIGFFIGGLLVATAASTFDQQKIKEKSRANTSLHSMSMDEMTTILNNTTGDEYDKKFIESMIAHHEGAIEMAQLSSQNARHDEIKKLSLDIIAAQKKEINDMKQWQKDWGYTKDDRHTMSDHSPSP